MNRSRRRRCRKRKRKERRKKQKVLGRTNRLLSFDTRRISKQIFYCWVCINCSSKVFAEPLPSNDRGIHMKTTRLMGGIYEVRL
jgi:hypothetical protein